MSDAPAADDGGGPVAAAQAFERALASRRSRRQFSTRPVPRAAVESLIRAASSAPSGAHKQPWTFCAVSDPALKADIRAAAEREERESYANRMSEEWLRDLEPLGTDWRKPFLEDAPWLVVLFKQVYGLGPDGAKRKHYYVNESAGIAAGFFLAAVHAAGLASLTHTPSPMGFLHELLGRPDNERPFLLMPVGYPAPEARPPELRRKALHEVAAFYTG